MQANAGLAQADTLLDDASMEDADTFSMLGGYGFDEGNLELDRRSQ